MYPESYNNTSRSPEIPLQSDGQFMGELPIAPIPPAIVRPRTPLEARQETAGIVPPPQRLPHPAQTLGEATLRLTNHAHEDETHGPSAEPTENARPDRSTGDQPRENNEAGYDNNIPPRKPPDAPPSPSAGDDENPEFQAELAYLVFQQSVNPPTVTRPYMLIHEAESFSAVVSNGALHATFGVSTDQPSQDATYITDAAADAQLRDFVSTVFNTLNGAAYISCAWDYANRWRTNRVLVSRTELVNPDGVAMLGESQYFLRHSKNGITVDSFDPDILPATYLNYRQGSVVHLVANDSQRHIRVQPVSSVCAMVTEEELVTPRPQDAHYLRKLGHQLNEHMTILYSIADAANVSADDIARAVNDQPTVSDVQTRITEWVRRQPERDRNGGELLSQLLESTSDIYKTLSATDDGSLSFRACGERISQYLKAVIEHHDQL